ncbi:MAG: nucleotide exchange factor GrpE [Eubacteriales bacterium]|nr:nucleotide exchange factor GrpE [Eubacteriales bacterium]
MSKKEKNTAPTQEEKTEAEVTVEEEKKEPTLEDQLQDAKDQLLRTAAEYANFRARSAKEKEQTYSNAKGNVVADILPSIDNLERALSQESADYESLKKGVQMTMDSLMAALEKMGVTAFGEVGDKFDPNYHNAVMHIEDDSLEENVITDVFQKGYKINDRVIRPAMVKTAN